MDCASIARIVMHARWSLGLYVLKVLGQLHFSESCDLSHDIDESKLISPPPMRDWDTSISKSNVSLPPIGLNDPWSLKNSTILMLVPATNWGKVWFGFHLFQLLLHVLSSIGLLVIELKRGRNDDTDYAQSFSPLLVSSTCCGWTCWSMGWFEGVQKSWHGITLSSSIFSPRMCLRLCQDFRTDCRLQEDWLDYNFARFTDGHRLCWYSQTMPLLVLTNER